MIKSCVFSKWPPTSRGESWIHRGMSVIITHSLRLYLCAQNSWELQDSYHLDASSKDAPSSSPQLLSRHSVWGKGFTSVAHIRAVKSQNAGPIPSQWNAQSDLKSLVMPPWAESFSLFLQKKELFSWFRGWGEVGGGVGSVSHVWHRSVCMRVRVCVWDQGLVRYAKVQTLGLGSVGFSWFTHSEPPPLPIKHTWSYRFYNGRWQLSIAICQHV